MQTDRRGFLGALIVAPFVPKLVRAMAAHELVPFQGSITFPLPELTAYMEARAARAYVDAVCSQQPIPQMPKWNYGLPTVDFQPTPAIDSVEPRR